MMSSRPVKQNAYGGISQNHRRQRSSKSRQQTFNDAGSFNTCQAHIQALVFHTEPLMVDPQIVQDRGIQIVNVNRVLESYNGTDQRNLVSHVV